MDAPRLTSKTDKLKYRNDARMRMQRVRVFANGGDTKAKGISKGSGLALYPGTEPASQKIIDAEMHHGKISLRPNDEEEVLSYQDHKEIIENFLQLVTKDSSTDVAKRFINTDRMVFSCKHAKTNSYADFAEWFRGIVREHLNCSEYATIEQEMQKLAVVLFDNAMLQDSIYIKLVSILAKKSADPKKLLRT